MEEKKVQQKLTILEVVFSGHFIKNIEKSFGEITTTKILIIFQSFS